MDRSVVVSVHIDSLLAPDSPRLAGENAVHAELLAMSGAELPPVVVHRATNRIVDGLHRLRAAQLRGQDRIDVVFFDGDDAAAFVFAVEANIRHGLTLSLADRTAAADRILASHPHWSDRRIAEVTGLADTTVASIRRCSTAVMTRSNTRVGRDGRARPVDGAAGRHRVAELMANKPQASIREIAREAGVSPSTALDVRRRLANGEHPVPMRQRHDHPPKPARQTTKLGGPGRNGVPPPDTDTVEALRRLVQDPSLRFTEAGRELLRWLSSHMIDKDESMRIVSVVPAHWAGTVAELARSTGHAWHRLAARLEQEGPTGIQRRVPASHADRHRDAEGQQHASGQHS